MRESKDLNCKVWAILNEKIAKERKREWGELFKGVELLKGIILFASLPIILPELIYSPSMRYISTRVYIIFTQSDKGNIWG